MAFREKYIPVTVCEQNEVEFLELTHRNFIVAKYEAKFVELSRCAPHVVVDEARKAYKFG